LTPTRIMLYDEPLEPKINNKQVVELEEVNFKQEVGDE